LYHILIANDDECGAVDDGPHGQFGLKRYADLTHKDQIQRRAEYSTDLGSNGHSTARQGETHRLPLFVASERLG
jgi:hypothetical protein